MSRKKRYDRNIMSPKDINLSPFETSGYLNDRTYINIYNEMKELALNLYEYENMPESVDIRYMELMLYLAGYCFFFREDVTQEYYTLGGTFSYGYDVYGNWANYTAISFNGTYSCDLNCTNSVIIYNNYTRIPTDNQVKLFAFRAWNILRTIDVNVSQQKTSKMLKVPEQRRLTLQNLLMKVQGNQIYALVADDLIGEEITTLDLTVPYIADKLLLAYNSVWNEYYNFLGIVNHASQKRERETSIEVAGHLGSTEMQRNTMYRSRKEAFDKINRMYGLDIKVRFNSDLKNFFDNNMINLWEGDGEDVNIHDINTDDS